MIGDAAQARAALQLGIPVVNIAGVLKRSTIPRVIVDQHAVDRR